MPDVGDEEGSGALGGSSTEAGPGDDDGAGTHEDYELPVGGVDGDGVGGDDINSVAPLDPAAGGVGTAKLGGPPPARKHVAAPRPRKVGAAHQKKARPPARVLGSRTRVAAPQRASPEISDPSDLQFAPENTARADDDPAAPATGGGGGGGGGGDASRNCFSGDTLVRTASGNKLMKDLEVGDMVSKVSSSYVKIGLFATFLSRFKIA